MPPPKRKSPRRPASVPAEATFDETENEWVIGAWRGDRRVGDWTAWRPDGTLVVKSSFDTRGDLDGICRRFHPDGRVSLESRYSHGVRWGRTRHTRSLAGDSPEDVHMAHMPPQVFEFAYAYKAGEVGPLSTLLGRRGVKNPPAVRLGVLASFARDFPKYLPGTTMLTVGSVVDIAKRRFNLPALFYEGPAMKDGSILRFAFEPRDKRRKSGLPAWQDPDWGTVVSRDEAAKKLIVGVDFADAILAPGRSSPEMGFRVDQKRSVFSVLEVQKGGVAAKAGLKIADVVLAANGRSMKSTLDYCEACVAYAETGRVELGLKRAGKRLVVELRAKKAR